MTDDPKQVHDLPEVPKDTACFEFALTLIREHLQEHFSEDAFLGEETGQSDFQPDQGIWVVDPIDGTQPFISGMSGWCESIAFLRGDTLELLEIYGDLQHETLNG